MAITRTVSADSHFLEPPTLWTERLDKQYRERGPQTVVKDGTTWLCGEDMQPQPVSGWCAAGRASEDLVKVNELGWDAAPKEVWNPADRLSAQDRDGVSAEILYTSFGMVAMNIKDVDLAMSCLRVFNDYAAEYCSYDWKRLVGIGAVIPDDVPAAVKEIDRLAKLGLRGIMLPLTLVPGESYADPKYDPIWAAAQDKKLVISFHAGTSRAGINPNPKDWAQIYMIPHYHMQRILTDVILAGVFDRFPGLRFVSVENDVSWLPHYAFRLDHFAERFVAIASVKLKMTPTEYLKRHFFSTFQFEGPGIDSVRRVLGSEIIMWGNDFPHLDSTWPNSPTVIRETLLENLPQEDVENIVYNNVVSLYDLSV